MRLEGKKLLYIGYLQPGQTSLMRMNAIKRLGFEVLGVDVREIMCRYSWIVQNTTKLTERGSFIRDINKHVCEVVNSFRPAIVWLDKQEYLYPTTVQRLKRIGATVIFYTPDPYFTVKWKHTNLSDACMPMMDLCITAKTYEIEFYRSLGTQVYYMPLAYCDEMHRRIHRQYSEAFQFGFIGGWEPRRQALLESLAAKGLKVHVWGYGWDHLLDGKWSIRRQLRIYRLSGQIAHTIQRSKILENAITPFEILGDNYVTTLNETQVSIGFLRTVWPDQHTTRTFEIPACASMLLADRTEEHLSFFCQGKEADFFSCEDELLEKAVYYARNPTIRERVSAAGYDRCVRSGYSYYSRLKELFTRLPQII
jgi:spore maturation protein CgeB